MQAGEMVMLQVPHGRGSSRQADTDVPVVQSQVPPMDSDELAPPHRGARKQHIEKSHTNTNGTHSSPTRSLISTQDWWVSPTLRPTLSPLSAVRGALQQHATSNLLQDVKAAMTLLKQTCS